MEAKGQRATPAGSGRHSKLSADSEDWAQDKAAQSGKVRREGKGLGGSDSKGALGAEAAAKLMADSFDVAEEKARILEIQQELEAEAEFERLRAMPAVVAPCVAKSTVAREFVRGFEITSMSMRDASSGRLMWRSSNWDPTEMFTKEVVEEVPREILSCRVVSREIIFSSKLELDNFRLEQRVFFKGVCIEEWFFKFGYVMSGSRNSWQQTIDAAPPEQMLSAEALSGQVVFETSFFEDQKFLCKNTVRIYYV